MGQLQSTGSRVTLTVFQLGGKRTPASQIVFTGSDGVYGERLKVWPTCALL